MINFDCAASGEKGLTALGGKEFSKEYGILTTVNESLNLGTLIKRGNAPISDHYFFLESGVKTFYIYTRDGTQPYHHRSDVLATLEWDDFEHLFLLSSGFIETLF